MAKRHRKRLQLFILIVSILWITFACRQTDATVELSYGDEWRFYSINPDTILESLAQGNTDVFTLLAATPEVTLPTPAASVQWSQEDYFRIAQAIHERSWGEPLGDENLFSMEFKMNCSDVARGTFGEASFDSVKIIQTGEEEARIEHWIVIRPSENLVYTNIVEYRPNARYKNPIALSQYRITVDEGLQIAESNGGHDARLKVDNVCEISAFTPSVNGGGWQITYDTHRDDSYHSLFTIAINPQTGNYKVLYPKP